MPAHQSRSTDVTKGRTDGYIFGMIRNGRGAMPSYNRIEEMDRWDVVNYVRALQGESRRAGRDTVRSPAARARTGDKVPGSTRIGADAARAVLARGDDGRAARVDPARRRRSTRGRRVHGPAPTAPQLPARRPAGGKR